MNGKQRCICNSGYIGETCGQRAPAEDDSILQVESETQAEADVEVQTDDQVKIGGHLIAEIQDRPIPVCNPGFPVQTVIRLYALIDVLANCVESSIIMHTVTQIFKSRFLKKKWYKLEE